jgi:hypothetical protein
VALYVVSQRLRRFPYPGARALALFAIAVAVGAARVAWPEAFDSLFLRGLLVAAVPLAGLAFLVSGLRRP